MRVLVTGGGGFLGAGIVRRLLARGDDVRILARGSYPALRSAGADTRQGDIRDPEATMAACEDRDTVYHVAAKVGYFGDPALFDAVNVRGTGNVIAGCLRSGVKQLVYTSTPSVVHGGFPLEGVDESHPYPSRHLADYPRTKALAEEMVLAADGAGTRTVALRPRGIWGPGDTQLLPILVRWAKAGRLRQIGAADPLQDFTYIGNAVDAHLLAADRLAEGADIGGRAFFISDGDPVGCWSMAEQVLSAAGAPGPAGKLSAKLAIGVGTLFEVGFRLMGLQGEPPMTRFKAVVLSQPCWFDIRAARRDLRYEPKVSRAEGLERLARWCAEGGLAD